LGERLDRTQEVGGSSPPSSTPRARATAGVLVFGPPICGVENCPRERRKGPKRGKLPSSGRISRTKYAAGRRLRARASRMARVGRGGARRRTPRRPAAGTRPFEGPRRGLGRRAGWRLLRAASARPGVGLQQVGVGQGVVDVVVGAIPANVVHRRAADQTRSAVVWRPARRSRSSGGSGATARCRGSTHRRPALAAPACRHSRRPLPSARSRSPPGTARDA
jgi:hypothetical protein